MSRGTQTFKQRDVTKAIKAMVRAGVKGHVEIAADGRIKVVVGSPDEERDHRRADEWD